MASEAVMVLLCGGPFDGKRFALPADTREVELMKYKPPSTRELLGLDEKVPPSYVDYERHFYERPNRKALVALHLGSR